MMGLVREGKSKIQGPCFLVTWDIDSEDRRAVGRAQYFLFGRTYQKNGKRYSYRGFVWRDGVRYVAQSAVLVAPGRLMESSGSSRRTELIMRLSHSFDPEVRRDSRNVRRTTEGGFRVLAILRESSLHRLEERLQKWPRP